MTLLKNDAPALAPTNVEASVALEEFMAQEAGHDAEGGLAYVIAKSLKEEADEGGPTALQNLPPLKLAILIYAIEQSREDSEDSEG